MGSIAYDGRPIAIAVAVLGIIRAYCTLVPAQRASFMLRQPKRSAARVASTAAKPIRGIAIAVPKEQINKELDEELNGFLEMAAEEKMKQGDEPKDALRAVRLERGNLEVTKEVVRSAGWIFCRDIVAGFAPWTAYPAQESGLRGRRCANTGPRIGATSAIFSVVNAVLLRPLAMEDPSHVVFVQETWRDIFPGVAVGNFVDSQKAEHLFRGTLRFE